MKRTTDLLIVLFIDTSGECTRRVCKLLLALSMSRYGQDLNVYSILQYTPQITPVIEQGLKSETSL
jgi:hypothetical protein